MKENKNILENIFLKYKKSLVHNDTEFSEKIEKIISILPERKANILYGRYIKNLSMTSISISLNIDRSTSYKWLSSAEKEFLELYR